MHLIQIHGYPKQYFFAVTNKGIGGLLRKWGEGASLLRGEWKAREEEKEMSVVDEDREDEENTTATTTPRAHTSHEQSQQPQHQSPSSSSAAIVENDTTMEDLTTNLRSISLVPDKIRFGRGGTKKTISRGFVPPSSHREASKRPPNPNPASNSTSNHPLRGHGHG